MIVADLSWISPSALGGLVEVVRYRLWGMRSRLQGLERDLAAVEALLSTLQAGMSRSAGPSAIPTPPPSGSPAAPVTPPLPAANLVRCRICGLLAALEKSGVFSTHGRDFGGTMLRCEGSGTAPLGEAEHG